MADTIINSWDKSGHAGPCESHTAAAVKDRAHGDESALAAKAKEAGCSAVEKTKNMASSVVQNLEDAASTIGHKAEGAVDSVGGGMNSLASTIRQNAPAHGVLGSAAAGVASSLESGGAYLQEQNLHGMAEDLTSLIRRYPIQALLVVVGVGFLVGRASRS